MKHTKKEGGIRKINCNSSISKNCVAKDTIYKVKLQ
jgi:hypothetical protein